VQFDLGSMIVNSVGDGSIRLNIHGVDLDGNPAPDCVIQGTPEQCRALVNALKSEISNAQAP
jgi:hypothetical protein